MSSIQTKSSLSSFGPRVSMFDKKGQANLSRLTKLSNMPTPKGNVNLPKVRINQHKGA
ncbi:MAG: hypothetical protein WA152_03675 [Microgenomates group bacterium]